MGLRLLAILLLLHASIAPALAAAREVARMEAPTGCCVDVCGCAEACPCEAGADPSPPSTPQDPATPARGAAEALRLLTLPGTRVIETIPPAARASFGGAPDQASHRPPAAFRGGSAQASLCVRTT